MKKRCTLMLAGAMLVSTYAFSKGAPPSVFVSYQGNYLVSETPGAYTGVTHHVEINPGDSCNVYAQTGSMNPIQYMKIFRDGMLIHDKTNGSGKWLPDQGYYEVKVYNGVVAEITVKFTVEYKTLGISNTSEPFVSALLYPNPCTHQLTIKAGEHDLKGSLSIVDMSGKQVWSQNMFSLPAGSQYTLSTAQWQEGIYFIQVFNGSETQRFRVVKN